MKKATCFIGLTLGLAAAATAYTLYKLDFFHDDAADYAIFESHRG